MTSLPSLAAAVLFLTTLAACAPLPTAPPTPTTPAPAAQAAATPPAAAQPADAALHAAAKSEVPAFLKTLEGLVGIESGSRDLEGLSRVADVVADRLRQTGMQVERKAAQASAVADVRSLTNADLDLMEAAVKKSIQDTLIPDTSIELSLYRSRPAFVSNAASLAPAQRAVQVYGEIGLPLEIRDRATGGGTDEAFASLRAKGGVLESFGLRGFGSHSSNDEYVLVSNIAPRLYLASRMVMEAGSGRVRW